MFSAPIWIANNGLSGWKIQVEGAFVKKTFQLGTHHASQSVLGQDIETQVAPMYPLECEYVNFRQSA